MCVDVYIYHSDTETYQMNSASWRTFCDSSKEKKDLQILPPLALSNIVYFVEKTATMERDPKNPACWKPAYLCREIEPKGDNKSLKKSLLDICDCIDDDCTSTVRLHIQGTISELHAADARYHVTCWCSYTGSRAVATAAHFQTTLESVYAAFNCLIQTAIRWARYCQCLYLFSSLQIVLSSTWLRMTSRESRLELPSYLCVRAFLVESCGVREFYYLLTRPSICHRKIHRHWCHDGWACHEESHPVRYHSVHPHRSRHPRRLRLESTHHWVCLICARCKLSRHVNDSDATDAPSTFSHTVCGCWTFGPNKLTLLRCSGNLTPRSELGPAIGTVLAVGLTFFWPHKKDHSWGEHVSLSLDLPEVLLFALTTVSVSLWRTSTASAGISRERNDFFDAMLAIKHAKQWKLLERHVGRQFVVCRFYYLLCT